MIKKDANYINNKLNELKQSVLNKNTKLTTLQQNPQQSLPKKYTEYSTTKNTYTP